MHAIALHVGYSTASAFGRVFKKRTGLSPSAYFKEHVSAGVRI
ncbi:helix-turn-helix domain-containing protein [Corynebacterium stationis]